GLDMYSLFESIESVIRYLEEVSPLMARRAKKRYACFDQFSGDEMLYARSTLKLPEGCAEEVTHNLEDLLKLSLASDVRGAKVDDLIDAQQSARVVQSAARYYRAMIRGDNESWNIRDRHMMETLSWLLAAEGREHKAVVWAHNTHVGDYRATDMTKDGLVNLGGLARERLGEHEVAIVGFGSYDGRMVAARAWDGPLQEMAMPPAKKDSLDAVYHSIAREWRSDRIVTLFGEAAPTPPLRTPLDQRAIGVVFDPDHERGNYTSTVVSSRYDAYFHIDRTTALTPLVLSHEREKIPATWPLGR
ncbi:MAG: erythromycin esterase family protein, partial [Oligoflexia bacterium]|nr:erythromycin esterase family protein [Oligoflexia bacterium]